MRCNRSPRAAPWAVLGTPRWGGSNRSKAIKDRHKGDWGRRYERWLRNFFGLKKDHLSARVEGDSRGPLRGPDEFLLTLGFF